jgi:DNA-binding PadR family transcriptional regulator
VSVKHAVLTLLQEQPQHGYHLKAEFERRTGGTWPLNVGQVYTTLQRLERDGLVSSHAPADDGSVVYETTPLGTSTVREWWDGTVDRAAPARDELTIKIALAVTTPGVDVASIVRRQRTASLQLLQALNRARAGARDDLAWSLVLDRLSFDAQAEAQWLDHVEASLARRAAGAARPGPAARTAALTTTPRTTTTTTTGGTP